MARPLSLAAEAEPCAIVRSHDQQENLYPSRHRSRRRRPRSRQQLRHRQSARLSRLDHPLPDHGEVRESRSVRGLRLRPQRHADPEGAGGRGRRHRGRASLDRRAVRPRRRHRRDRGLPEDRRPHAADRQRLRPGAALRQHHAQELRRRDDLLRSDDRRRHREADPAQHQGGLSRGARLADLRGAGRRRDRRASPRSTAPPC